MKRATATDTIIAPYLDKIICLRWSGKQAYPLSADQIQNLIAENNLLKLNDKKFLKASNGYWLVTENLGDIEPYVLINNITKDWIYIFIGKEGTWTTTWHAELFHQGDQLADIIIDWKLYSADITKKLRGEIAYLYQSNEKITMKTFLEHFDEIICVLVLKNTDNLFSAIYFMMARSQLLDKFDYNSTAKSDKYKLLYAKFSPDTIKLQMLFSEEVNNQELFLEALRDVEGQETQIEKTQNFIQKQKNLLANEKKSVDRDQRQAIVAKSESELNNLKAQNDTLIQIYTEGILMAKEIAKLHFTFPYSSAKTTASLYLQYYLLIMNEAQILDSPNYSTEQIVVQCERYKGARKYLKTLFNLQLAGEKIMDHLPEKMSTLAKKPIEAWYIAYRREYTDYQLSVVAEELAKSEYTAWANVETEIGLDYESNISLLSAIILFRIRKSYDKKPANFSAKQMLSCYLNEKSTRDPLFPGERPAGYYSLNDFKSKNTYDGQYEFNEQFNVYREKFLNYDVRVLASHLLASTTISRLETVAKVSEQHLFRIEKFIGDDQQHNGNVLCMKTNGRWFIIADLDGKLMAEFFPKDNGVLRLLPEVFTNPRAKLGSITETIIFSDQDQYPPTVTRPSPPIYYPADKTPLKEIVELRIFWLRMGYDTLDTTPQLTIVDNDTVYHNKDKCVVYNVLTFVEKSIQVTVSNAQLQLDETGVWHKIAICLIPFYEVIYKAATDRKYSPSAEDIVSIVMDVIATLAIIVDAGVRISQLTDEIIRKITVEATSMKLAGFSQRKIITQAALLMAKESTTVLLPSVIKVLTTSLLELINPIPFINISDVARYTYQYSSRMLNTMTTPAKSGFFDPFLIGQKVNPDLSDAVYIDPAELIPGPIREHTNIPGKIYKKNYFEGSEPRYIINNDNKFYRVKWDNHADSWRMMIATDIDNYRRGPIVKFVENQWVIYPETVTFGESYANRKLTPDLKKALQHGNSFLLTQSYDQQMKIFHPTNDYIVLPVIFTDIHNHGFYAFSAQLAGEEMQKIAKNLLDYAGKYSATGKHILIDSLINQLNHITTSVNKAPHRLTHSTTFSASLSDYYALIKKGPQDNVLAEQVYGFLCLNSKSDTGSVQVEYLFNHPYIIANNFSGFREYLLKNDLVSVETLNKYNLQLSASHLLSTGLLNSIYKIETDYGIPLNYIRIRQQDATAEPLIVALQNSSDYNSTLKKIVSQTTFSVQEKLPPSLADLAPGKPYLAGFKPLSEPFYLDEYELAAELNHFLTHEGYKIGADNLVVARQSSVAEYRHFAEEVKRSADNVCQIYRDIHDILQLSKKNQQAFASIKDFLSDISGLNEKNAFYDPKYQDNTPLASITDSLFKHFEDKISRGRDYMLKQKERDYSNFVIVKETGTPGLFSEEIELKNKIFGFVIPGDAERKIYLSLPPEETNGLDLTLDILHQSSHAAALTSDLAYPGHHRFGINRLTSIYDEYYRSYKTFFDCRKNDKLVTGYILNIDKSAEITADNIAEAINYFSNNKLVRADVLFHTTEFNTRMVNHFNEIYKLDETRKKIIQEPFIPFPCNYPRVKRESEKPSRKIRGLDADCASTSRLDTIQINGISYNFVNFDDKLFSLCIDNHEHLQSLYYRTPHQEFTQSYQQGAKDYRNTIYHHFDKLTPNQKMEQYLAKDKPYSNNELGALYLKIIIDASNYSNYNIAKKSIAWSKKASDMGANKVDLFPQHAFLIDDRGVNIAQTVVVSWAIENNMESLITNRLHSLSLKFDPYRTSLYKNLSYFADYGKSLEFCRKHPNQLVTIQHLHQNIKHLFQGNIKSLALHYSRKTMSITLCEKNGIKVYAFYNPNLGISYFKKYDQLCDFIKLDLQRLPDFSGGSEIIIIDKIDFSGFEKIEINGKNIRQIVTDEKPERLLPATESMISISSDLDDRGPFTSLGLSRPFVNFDIEDEKFRKLPFVSAAYSIFTLDTESILEETRINMEKINAEKNQKNRDKVMQSMKYTEAKLKKYAAHAGILVTDGKKVINYKNGFLNIVLTPKQREQFPGQGKLDIPEAKYPLRYFSKIIGEITFDHPAVKAKYYQVNDLDSFIAGIKDYYLITDGKNPLHPLIEKRIKEHIEYKYFLLPNTSGIPGFHAEVQALNYVLNQATLSGTNLDKVLNQSYIFTQRLAGQIKGSDFKACHNCTAILSGLEHVMTGKVGNQGMFTFRHTF